MSSERRKYDRFETDAKIEFQVTFDIRTKVDFTVKTESRTPRKKYSAISRNISVEGLAFESSKDLAPGDLLALDVYIPSSDVPVPMEGVVRWCVPVNDDPKNFDTGVLITKVQENVVANSIIIDPVHRIVWSLVLESIFGNFKHLMLKRKISSDSSKQKRG